MHIQSALAGVNEEDRCLSWRTGMCVPMKGTKSTVINSKKEEVIGNSENDEDCESSPSK